MRGAVVPIMLIELSRDVEGCARLGHVWAWHLQQDRQSRDSRYAVGPACRWGWRNPRGALFGLAKRKDPRVIPAISS